MQSYADTPSLMPISAVTCGICHDSNRQNNDPRSINSKADKSTCYCSSCINFKILKIKLNLINLEFFNSKASEEINKVLADCIKGHSASFLQKYLKHEADSTLNTKTESELDNLVPSLDAIARLSYMLLNVEISEFRKNLKIIKANIKRQKQHNEQLRLKIEATGNLAILKRKELDAKTTLLREQHKLRTDSIIKTTNEMKGDRLLKIGKLIDTTRSNHFKQLINILNVRIIDSDILKSATSSQQITLANRSADNSTIKLSKRSSTELDRLNESLLNNLKNKQAQVIVPSHSFDNEEQTSVDFKTMIFFTPVIPVSKMLYYSSNAVNNSLENLSTFVELASKYLDIELPFPILKNYDIDSEDELSEGDEEEDSVAGAEDNDKDTTINNSEEEDDDTVNVEEDKIEPLSDTEMNDDKDDTEKESSNRIKDKMKDDSKPQGRGQFIPITTNRMFTEMFPISLNQRVIKNEKNQIESLIELNNTELKLFCGGLSRLIVNLLVLISSFKTDFKIESIKFADVLKLDELVESLVAGLIPLSETTVEQGNELEESSKVDNNEAITRPEKKIVKKGIFQNSVFNFWNKRKSVSSVASQDEFEKSVKNEKHDTSDDLSNIPELEQFGTLYLIDYLKQEKIDLINKLSVNNIILSSSPNSTSSSMISLGIPLTNSKTSSSSSPRLTNNNSSESVVSLSSALRNIDKLTTHIYEYFKASIKKQIEMDLMGNTTATMGLSLSSTSIQRYQQKGTYGRGKSMSESPKLKPSSLSSSNTKLSSAYHHKTNPQLLINHNSGHSHLTYNNGTVTDLKFQQGSPQQVQQQISPGLQRIGKHNSGMNLNAMNMTPAGTRLPKPSSKKKSILDNWEVI